MPRGRKVIRENTYPRNERIIIYCNKETKRRWQILQLDSDTNNYEDFANKLMDLYELTKKYLGKDNIDELIMRLHEILGVSVRLRIVDVN
jgi:hypothetical protein